MRTVKVLPDHNLFENMPIKSQKRRQQDTLRYFEEEREYFQTSCSTVAWIIPDVSMPSCSFSSWANSRLIRDHFLPYTSNNETSCIDSGISTTEDTVSATPSPHSSPSTRMSVTTSKGVSEVEWLSDEDCVDAPFPTETSSISKKGGCIVVPLTGAEHAYLERAHEESTFLDIYAEPCLRFITVPPIPYFIAPRVGSYKAVREFEDCESGYQSESSPPLPIDKIDINGVGTGEVAPAPSSITNTRLDKKGCQWDAVPSGSTAAVVATSGPSKKPQPPPIHRNCAPRAPPAGPVDASGKLEVSKMDVLSEEIWFYHNSVTQTETTLNKKLHLRDMLYYAICPVFPMCGLYVVGSSLNGFGNNSSDMDLCLMITNKDLDQKTDAVVVLNMILSTLRQVEWVAHQQLILAKVPILRIKFAAPFGDITVDLNANNSVAIKNTHLLCYYSSFDWRVRPLVTIVKEWAKRKGINDANRSSFTSYSLVLMVVHYLQCSGGSEPAVLPSLQQMYSNRFSNRCDVRSLNVTLPLQPPPDEWVYNDRATLGELLIGFLKYYANTFDYNRDAISVRLGKRVDRAIVAKHRPQANGGGNNWRSQWRCICIEEPFTFSNTAHSIYDEMVFDAIKDSFREAYEELDSSRDIQKLLKCKPIKAQPPNGGALVFCAQNAEKSDHVVAVTLSRNQRNGGTSVDSLHTAVSGRSSCANSTSGDDNDSDRNRDTPPLDHLMCPSVSESSSLPNGLHISGRHTGGRRRNNRKSGRM